MKNIKAVIFDAYGTLAQITESLQPYQQLIKLSASGRQNKTNYMQTIMSNPGFMEQAAYILGIHTTPNDMMHLRHLLNSEVGSVRLYDDCIPALTALKLFGLKIAVCSNCAEAYSSCIVDNLPFELDAHGWSYEVGTTKPNSAIYQRVLEKLNLPPDNVLFVGDSYRNDYQAPLTLGMKAIHLVREKDSSSGNEFSKYQIKSLMDLIDLLCPVGFESH